MRTKNAVIHRAAVRGLASVAALGRFQVVCAPQALKPLIAALLLISGASVHAGYAQLAPPPGAATTSTGQLAYKAAANEAWLQSTVRTNASLNVAGRTITVPVSMRLAANASTFVARSIFSHPLILAGTFALPYLIEWAGESKYSIDNPGPNGKWVLNTKVKQFECASLTPSQQASYDSCFSSATYSNKTRATKTDGAACSHGYNWSFQSSNPPYAMVNGYNGCVSTTKTEVEYGKVENAELGRFESDLGARPLPDNVPKELPFPVPVDLPIINPSPALQPQPLMVPTGDPVPNPNYNPSAPTSPANSPYQQPVVKVVPSPTAAEPWRVDLQPENVPLTGPEPIPEPEVNPNPQTDPNKSPQEDSQSLCEKHPDILACSKPELDSPDGEIPKAERNLTYTEENLFGSGACPANIYASIGGQQVMVYDWGQTCGVVSTYLRPIILLLGAMGALFILIPGRDA